MLFRKYLYRSVLNPLLSGIAGCTFLILLDTLSDMIENIVVRGVPFLQVMELLSYQMVNLLSFTVPMGMMIGGVIAYGNLANSNEITAFNSLGINLRKMLTPIFYLSTIITLILLSINQFITPVAGMRNREMIKRLAYDKPSVGLSAKQFITTIRGYAIYLDSFNYTDDSAGNFFIFSHDKGGYFPSVILGRAANWDNGYMNIVDSNAYDIDANGRKRAYAHFDRQSIPIRSKISGFDSFGFQDEENNMSLSDLYFSIRNRRAKNLSTLRYEVALHTKLALAFSPIVMAFLGALLAYAIHKRFRRGDGKLVGTLILFLYWIWVMSSRGIIMSNHLPVYIIWIPNILFLFIGLLIFLYKRRA